MGKVWSMNHLEEGGGRVQRTKVADFRDVRTVQADRSQPRRWGGGRTGVKHVTKAVIACASPPWCAQAATRLTTRLGGSRRCEDPGESRHRALAHRRRRAQVLLKLGFFHIVPAITGFYCQILPLDNGSNLRATSRKKTKRRRPSRSFD